MNCRYASTIASVGRLRPKTVEQMASLYLDNFDGSSRKVFIADLKDKDEAILLHANGRLAGFTTLKVFERRWKGEAVRIVYSGDTIVHREHWGQQQLAFAWISRIGGIKREAPATPLYWFLLVKGHRTFKYLAVFAKSFFPHWSLDRRDLKPLGDQLAEERFGSDYNPETGVVEFETSRGHLRRDIADAAPAELSKPAAQLFFQRNPGYRRGHELVCVCELELFNMKPMTARIFERALEEAAHPW